MYKNISNYIVKIIKIYKKYIIIDRFFLILSNKNEKCVYHYLQSKKNSV